MLASAALLLYYITWLQEEIADTVLTRLAGQLSLCTWVTNQHINGDMSAVITMACNNPTFTVLLSANTTDASWSAHATLSIDSNKGHYLAPHAFLLLVRLITPNLKKFLFNFYICLWQQR